MKRSAPDDIGSGGGGGGGGGGAPPPKKLTKAQSSAVEELLEQTRKAVEDNFQCSVCIHLVYEPVSSPCGHNACFECLCRVVAANPGAPLCPTCRGPIEPLTSRWSINSGVASALASNNGPGYRAQAQTLNFHALLREDKPNNALLCLRGGGVDLGKALRLSTGTTQNPLYYALKKESAAEWKELSKEMIRRGVDLDSGAGALDQCASDFSMGSLLIAKGAKKCTSVAFESAASLSYIFWCADNNAVDDYLSNILSFLPIPLSKVDSGLHIGLYHALRYGYQKTALKLLQAEVPLRGDLFSKTPAM